MLFSLGGVLLGATSDGTGSPTAAPLLAAAALLLASIAFALSFDYGARPALSAARHGVRRAELCCAPEVRP